MCRPIFQPGYKVPSLSELNGSQDDYHPEDIEEKKVPLKLPVRQKFLKTKQAWNTIFKLLNPGPRIHSISIHRVPKIHVYQHGYPWFWDVSLQLSIQVSTLISKQGYPCKDILQSISLNKYPWMYIHVLWISVFNNPCFYKYPFGYPWISMDIHALTSYGFSIQQGRYTVR